MGLDPVVGDAACKRGGGVSRKRHEPTGGRTKDKNCWDLHPSVEPLKTLDPGYILYVTMWYIYAVVRIRRTSELQVMRIPRAPL